MSPGPTRVVTTFHPSSSVLSSDKCSLSGHSQHLVVGKLDCVEVYAIQQDKLQLECSYAVNGKVRTVKAVPISEHRSNIFVLLDHPDPAALFLAYSQSSDTGIASLNLIENAEDLYERGSYPAEFCNEAVVHPNGKVIVLSVYRGRLKVILVKDGQPKPAFDVQIPELNLLGLTFAPSRREGSYILSLLHIDHKGDTQLISRDLTAKSSEINISMQHSEHLLPTTIPPEFMPYPAEAIPKLVAIPPQDLAGSGEFRGGILVVGGRKMLLYECSQGNGKRKRDDKSTKKLNNKRRKAACTVEWPWSDVAAVEAIDSNAHRIIIGDKYGRLAILSTIDVRRRGLILVPLGESSPPKSISYLDNQAVFIGSHLGNSQVLKIHTGTVTSDTSPKLTYGVKTVPKGSLDKDGDQEMEDPDSDVVDGYKDGRVVNSGGSYLTVLQTIENIAPILDAVLFDVDKSGQSQIVTCSGGANTGSINVVRMGADFDKLASVTGLENVTNAWPLRSSHFSDTHSYIVVSTLDETFIFRIESANTLSRVVTVNSFVTEVPTIAVHNMVAKDPTATIDDRPFVAQVTETVIRLLEYDSLSSQWIERRTVDKSKDGAKLSIVAASINSSQIIVALSGGRLEEYVIDWSTLSLKCARSGVLQYNDGPTENPHRAQSRPWRQSEISAITVNPVNDTANFSRHIAVSFWGTNQIKIYSCDSTGFTFVTDTPSLPATVRSLLHFNFGMDDAQGRDHRPHLIAGLANGSVVTFSMAGKGKEKTLQDMKLYLLEQRRFRWRPVASGDKSALFNWDKGRLHHSPVMLQNIHSVASFNGGGNYHNTLLLTTESEIHIGRIRDIKKMHVRRVPLGYNTPRKIIHVPSQRVFGVVVDRLKPDRIGEEEETTASLFKLFDDHTSKLGQFDYTDREIPMSLTTFTRTLLGEQEATTFIVLGTASINPEDGEPQEGRIVVLTAKQVSTPKLTLVEHVAEQVKGGVYSLSIINGLIAAAVNSSVVIFRFGHDSGTNVFSLYKVTEWNHSYLVSNVVTAGDHLVVSDYMNSVSVLKFKDNTKSRLETVARDFTPLMPLTVEAFDEERVIGADHNLNLFSFSVRQERTRKILKRDGFYHIGEIVTKLIRGSIAPPDPEKGLETTHLYFTSSGRIGLVVDVSDARLAGELVLLEMGLEKQYTEEGHAKYRAPRVSKGRSDADERAYGFIDGDFLEQLLALLESEKEEAKDTVENVFANSHETLGRIHSSRRKIRDVLFTLHGMHGG